MKPDYLSRRNFLSRCTGHAFGWPLAATLADLRLMNSVMAQAPVNDYKALVCVFLSGGNDANNMLAPIDGEQYGRYAAARGPLTLIQNPGTAAYLRPLNVRNNTSGNGYGVHSSLPDLQTLFDDQKLAFMTNVGTLVEPMTKAQYTDRTRKRPAQLFSHNDQVFQWQTSVSDSPTRTGWAGRMADILASANTGSSISMSISLAGFNSWEVGDVVSQYQISTSGAVTLTRNSGDVGSATARMTAIRDMLAMGRANLPEKDYRDVFQRAVNNADLLNTALTGADAGQNGALPLASSPLGQRIALPATDPLTLRANTLAPQLQMVARMINARRQLSMKRQVFFVQLGGWDTHNVQTTAHPALFNTINGALKGFWDTLVAMGVSNQVTTFSASDFGRTLQSNGSGSDHGWGTHQFMLGGAVQGGRLWGKFPNLAVNGPDDTGLGRWIPTTSVDQYGATLARWFGVESTQLNEIFPNLSRFATPDVGFLG
jgi:uncharacterized protein (DUF1501 family)